MGAIVLPVYLVPALAVILALGLAVETHPGWLPAIPRRPKMRQNASPGPQMVQSLPQPSPLTTPRDNG